MVEVIPSNLLSVYPLDADISQFKIAGKTVAEIITDRFTVDNDKKIVIRSDFLPSEKIVYLLENEAGIKIISKYDNSVAAYNNLNGMEIAADDESQQLLYPWDLLNLNEILLENIENDIKGTVRENVCIDGRIHLGRNSVLLPGVFIEGNVIIGENCKIGPNAYIRGKTSVGDNCHIGQAVEIKNSIICDKVSIGHLSYAGDSIIAPNVNFGAGTVISNLRHDGKDHKFFVGGRLVDTQRRKFGAVIGKDVHTGINTLIYPGRSIAPGSTTLPGEIIRK